MAHEGLTVTSEPAVTWYRVAGVGELPDGRVTTATAGHHSIALTDWQGRYGRRRSAGWPTTGARVSRRPRCSGR